MTSLEQRIQALDVSLFSPIEAQTNDWDRRASRVEGSPAPAVLALPAVPAIDRTVVRTRPLVRRP